MFDQWFPREISCLYQSRQLGAVCVCVCVCVCVWTSLQICLLCLSLCTSECADVLYVLCCVYIVLPYLNNKTGYEIQNQYTYLRLLICMCVDTGDVCVKYIYSVFTSRQKWLIAAKLQNVRVGFIVLLWIFFVEAFFFFSKYPFNFGGNCKNTPGSIFEKTPHCCQRWTFYKQLQFTVLQCQRVWTSRPVTNLLKERAVWWRIFIGIFKDVKPTARL